MISNWTEVDLEFFKEVFNRYWNKEEGTEEKVIEVQNLPFIFNLDEVNKSDGRVFFGNGYKIEDYVDWNKEEYAILKKISDLAKLVGMESLDDKCKISMCMLEGGPKIIPLGSAPDHYNIIMSLFGDEDSMNNQVKELTSTFMSDKLFLNYYKDDANDLYYLNNENNINLPEKIRIRIWQIEDWKHMIEEYINNNFNMPEEYRKDDIPAEKIKES